MFVTTLPLGTYAFVRVELSAVTRHGPFRLTVDLPTAHMTEYYATLAEALQRREALEFALDARLAARDEPYQGTV